MRKNFKGGIVERKSTLEQTWFWFLIGVVKGVGNRCPVSTPLVAVPEGLEG